MNVLIVHAHHEPQSFSSALKNVAQETLLRQGHQVAVSDLYAMQFDPVSDRHNFSSVQDPAYLKQQQEELHASEIGGFAPDILAEMEKLERADLLLFSFPLWWFAMPAILKGWVDRVFAMGRIYGGGKFYDAGIGHGKRAMVVATIGGPSTMYDGYGINPQLDTLLQPIEHGIFAFNGYAPLPAFVVHGPARMSQEERLAELQRLADQLAQLDQLTPRAVPAVSEFEGFVGSDRWPRFMVEMKRSAGGDGNSMTWANASAALSKELRRQGKLLSFHASAADDPHGTAWMLIREHSRDAVERSLGSLSAQAGLRFSVWEAARS
jgi:NAD(P)H dehydrogenase (quinone)